MLCNLPQPLDSSRQMRASYLLPTANLLPLSPLPATGFFMADDSDRLHQFNPGAGAQCEGDPTVLIPGEGGVEAVRQSGTQGRAV